MKPSHRAACGLASTWLALFSTAALADLQSRLDTLPAVQVGTEGIVSFGVMVDAHTNLNAIWASASYSIDCSDPKIRPALQGSRGWSDNGILGPRHIFVTAPEWIPAQQALPGWQGVMGGSFVSCVLVAKGAAKTHILPIGSGGTSFPVGGDYWEESTSQNFGVMKPGTSFGGGCIL
jgi:hypothetical protein